MNTVLTIPRRRRPVHVHIWRPWRLVAALTPDGHRRLEAWEVCTCGQRRAVR